MWATRRELAMLQKVVEANSDRLTRIDDMGTRGVGVVQSQLNELVKDVGELKGEMNAKFADHVKTHADDAKARKDDRRWLIGTAIAALASSATAIGLLLEILSRIH